MAGFTSQIDVKVFSGLESPEGIGFFAKPL
jgi:hypothetical protein